MTGALLLVLLASGLRPALGVALGEPLVPDSIFYQQSPDTGDMYVLCQQGVELAGQLIGTAVAPTPLDCAEKCWDDAECEVFNHIDCADVQVRPTASPAGPAELQGAQRVLLHSCRLLALSLPTCTSVPCRPATAPSAVCMQQTAPSPP